MGFVFRLERVLAVRRLQEEVAQQFLSRARETLRGERARLEAVEEDLRRAVSDVDVLKRTDELDAEALRLHSRYAGLQRCRVSRAREAVEGASRAVEDASRAVLDAHRARQALEKLRERDEAAWRAAVSRREACRIDAVAAARHRGRREEDRGH
ncbi:MAG: flagellar export protein FliJ [Deferrisomatales bacterium]|nr:flagellar export protein FliJ [Deferrisomatales bacterium]